MLFSTLSPQPRAVLWDLDGTLIDTAPIHWQAWREALKQEGFELSWETFTPTFGQRNDTVLRAWLGADLSDAEIVRVSAIKEDLYLSILRDTSLRWLPGAEHWLAQLRHAGWRQALATMTWRENLAAIFRALKSGAARSQEPSSLFDVIITADDVQRGKPDPEVFLLAAKRLGVSPDRCVVVEDSPAGIEAARRGGMRAIGIHANGALVADWVTSSLPELPDHAFDRLVTE